MDIFSWAIFPIFADLVDKFSHSAEREKERERERERERKKRER